MARLHGDGFDHYGTDTSNMTDGTYADANSCALSTTYAATGTHSLHINGNTGLFTHDGPRVVLPTAIDKVGAAARFLFPSLPNNNATAAIFAFLNSPSQVGQVTFFVGANGQIRVYRGHNAYGNGGNDSGASVGSGYGDGVLIAESDPAVVAGAWNHIEVQAYIHATEGWLRVAVNEVTVMEETNLNTLYDSTKVCSVAQYRPYNDAAGTFYMDDYHIYDFTGTAATDTDWCPTVNGSGVATNFIGELGAYILLPNGDDGTNADWQKSTGSVGYSLIDEATPSDVDYVYSDTATDLSEFALTDLPEDITYIRGLDLLPRMSKNDSGSATYQVGMESNASTTDATARVVTVEPTYWRDQINVDPDGGGNWTKTSLDAAKVRFTRAS